MKKTRTQKGITLVALIITIIVLLILAVVAISAVQDDGIIEYGKNARGEYQTAQGEENTTLGNYLEKINQNDPATIEARKDAEELELIKRYALGEEKTGRLATEILNLDGSFQVISFIDDKSTPEKENETITPLYRIFEENNTKAFIYAKYNNKVYKIVADFTSTYFIESVEMIYKKQGREGQPVKYDSDGKNGPEDWIIITDRGGKVEIVSADVMYGENNTGLTLGSGDTTVTVTSDLDGDKDTTDDYQDRAIASYNKAITTINNYCESLVTAENNGGVRSIGAAEEDEEIEEEYSSENFDSWFKNKETVKVRKGDMYFEEDLAKLYYHGIANVRKYYWVASRFVYEYSSHVDFYVRNVNVDSDFFGHYLWNVDSGGYVDDYYHSCGVRPVVINPSGI